MTEASRFRSSPSAQRVAGTSSPFCAPDFKETTMFRCKCLAIAAVAVSLAGCNEKVTNVIVIPVASVAISGSTAGLLPGGTVQLTARAIGPAGQQLQGRTFTWSTNNASVATVTNTGAVSLLVPG